MRPPHLRIMIITTVAALVLTGVALAVHLIGPTPPDAGRPAAPGATPDPGHRATGLQFAETLTLDAAASRPIARTESVIDSGRRESIVRTFDDENRLVAQSAAVGNRVLARTRASGRWMWARREQYDPLLRVVADALESSAPRARVIRGGRGPRPVGGEVEFDTVEMAVADEPCMRRELEQATRAMRTTLGKAPAQLVSSSRLRWTRWWDRGRLVAEELAAWYDAGGEPRGIVISTTFAPVDAGVARDVRAFARSAGWRDVLRAISTAEADRADSASTPASAPARAVLVSATDVQGAAVRAHSVLVNQEGLWSQPSSAPAAGWPAANAFSEPSPLPRSRHRPGGAVPRSQPGTSGGSPSTRPGARGSAPRAGAPGRAPSAGVGLGRGLGGALGTGLMLIQWADAWYEFGQAVGRKVRRATDALNRFEIPGPAARPGTEDRTPLDNPPELPAREPESQTERWSAPQDADQDIIKPEDDCLTRLEKRELEEELRVEGHHIASWMNGRWWYEFFKIMRKYGLQSLRLDERNIIWIPHRGPHPEGYHRWIHQNLKRFDRIAKGDSAAFWRLWERLRQWIARNPTVVLDDYWC